MQREERRETPSFKDDSRSLRDLLIELVVEGVVPWPVIACLIGCEVYVMKRLDRSEVVARIAQLLLHQSIKKDLWQCFVFDCTYTAYVKALLAFCTHRWPKAFGDVVLLKFLRTSRSGSSARRPASKQGRGKSPARRQSPSVPAPPQQLTLRRSPRHKP
jgi:hypothetical protein